MANIPIPSSNNPAEIGRVIKRVLEENRSGGGSTLSQKSGTLGGSGGAGGGLVVNKQESTQGIQSIRTHQTLHYEIQARDNGDIMTDSDGNCIVIAVYITEVKQ